MLRATGGLSLVLVTSWGPVMRDTCQESADCPQLRTPHRSLSPAPATGTTILAQAESQSWTWTGERGVGRERVAVAEVMRKQESWLQGVCLVCSVHTRGSAVVCVVCMTDPGQQQQLCWAVQLAAAGWPCESAVPVCWWPCSVLTASGVLAAVLSAE